MAASHPQVDSDLAPPTNPINNGKRGAEEVVEPQVVGTKKHKKTEGQNEVERPPATTQDDPERVSISNEYKEEDKDDCSTQDPQTPNRRNALKQKCELLLDHPTRLDLATEHNPTHDTGSKTLFLGNLSFLIEEDDVRDFFKNVGEIADIRFAIKDDRFLGYGHIEFATAEAAQEALKLNKEVLLDRRVALEYTRRQRGAYTPGNSLDKSNQRGGCAQVKTVYVRGFESSDGFDNIQSRLEKHFEKCGEISRVYIQKDHVSGAPTGVAFIEFTDRNGFRQALGLDGSEVGGSRLTVEEAKKQRGDGWSGIYVRESGSGGGRSASAGNYDRETGSRGGSAGSHVRESGSGGGRNGSRGGWIGSAGSYARDSGSVGGWSGSGGGWSGYGGGWSGCAGSYARESGSGSSYGQESGSGGSYARESGSGSSYGRESGSGGSYGRESGSGGSYGRESGSGGSYGRERGSRGGWRRESGYGSRLCMESGYGSVSHTESGSGGGWRRESGYGRGGWGWEWESGNGYGYGYGGWGRGSSSRSNDGGFSSSGGGRVSSHRVGSRRGGLP